MFAIACSENKEIKFDFPEIPLAPASRSAAEPGTYKMAFDQGLELAESQYCFCLRNSENITWALCEQLADEKLATVLNVQKSENVSNMILRAYVETKNRCKLQMGIIDSLPDIDN